MTLSLEQLAELEDGLRAAGAVSVDHARPGLDRAEIDAVADRMGVRFGEEAYIWWGWRDGVDQQAGLGYPAVHLTPAYLWMGLEASAAERRVHEPAVTRDPENVWPAGWLSLGDSVSMEHLVIDAAGGPVHCPIHYYDPMFEDQPLVPKLASMGELVAIWLRALNDGTWTPDPDNPGAPEQLAPRASRRAVGGELWPLVL